jgi:two-component system sensor histidine kinase/response regulator
MAGSGSARILYMEDDAGLARLLQKRLEREGYTVSLARDGQEGLAMCEAAAYDLVAVDQNMPIYDGLEVIRRLALQGPLPPLIMVTGTGNEQIAVEAMKIGAHDYIVKDVEGGYLDLLPAVIEQVIGQHRLAEAKRQTDAALRQHTTELQARNEELDAFAHTVAHDLKNPLSVLVSYAELLYESHDTMAGEELEQCYGEIMRTANKMCNIVDELLLLSAVRRQKVELEPLLMASIVAAARHGLAGLIDDAQAEIVAADDWPPVWGYGPWVEEVWVNLLSNALKYGRQPGRDIPLRIELGTDQQTGPAAGRQLVRFWVRDNGPGISPEEQARLFAEFARIRQLSTLGHGLGLSIVRRIVERLGGQVGVESAVGQGSLFYFALQPVELDEEGRFCL